VGGGIRIWKLYYSPGVSHVLGNLNGKTTVGGAKKDSIQMTGNGRGRFLGQSLRGAFSGETRPQLRYPKTGRCELRDDVRAWGKGTPPRGRHLLEESRNRNSVWEYRQRQVWGKWGVGANARSEGTKK